MVTNDLDRFVTGEIGLFDWHLAYQRTSEYQATAARYRALAGLRRRVVWHNRRAAHSHIDGRLTIVDVQSQLDRQKRRCFYCRKELPNRYELEHVKPVSRGGRNTPDNVVIACKSCNSRKGRKLLHESRTGLLL